jgi:DNA-binding transcriptional ArsR family regulator
MSDEGQIKDNKSLKSPEHKASHTDFVLEKSIFSNIFEKDIRRVYMYKKAERLAKAIHLVAPAFRTSPALRDRMDIIAIGLVDAAINPPVSARHALSRELLALSSILSIARTGGLLSSMNADLIAHEAQQMLQEIASYEEPRLFLDDAPSLAELAKELVSERHTAPQRQQLQGQSKAAVARRPTPAPATDKGQRKGHLSDKSGGRRDAIRAVLKTKGPSYIKDVSTVIRDVSEKTIQRELQAMVEEGSVTREGERRWTTYSLA